MRFFGREDIIGQLNDLWGKSVSSFVTCRGRRRIGKSTLVEKFATEAGARFLKIEGVKPTDKMTDEDERRSFAEQLALQAGTDKSCPDSWLSAFQRLSSIVRDDERTVILLDEVSWMAYFDEGFANNLKIAWDNYLRKHDRLILIVCASVSIWIRENIIENKAFYGRRSIDVVVPELPLRECVKFWGDRVDRVPVRDIIDFLSVTGGVPKYLEELNPSLSTVENLKRMAFGPNSVLRTDFDEMFTDVVRHQPKFAARVLCALIDGPKSVSEIAKAIGVERGGDISSALEQLSESGLVAAQGGKNPKTGEGTRLLRYRIRDNYARFYLKYLEPVKDMIDASAFAFTDLEQFAGWETDMGFQFENLVLNNFRDILHPLHLDKALVTSASPYVVRGSSAKGTAGCQIDLLIQTNMSICLVEIKRKAKIGREILDEMKRKCACVPRRRDVAVRTALVYDGELVRSIEAEGYFDAIISSRDLLGL